MKLVLKSTVALLVIFVALLGGLGWLQIRRETDAFQRAATKDLLVTGRSLRSMIDEVWQVEGRERAFQALERANASLVDLQVRWITLDSPAEAPPGYRAEDQRQRTASGLELTRVEQTPDGSKRVCVYVPLVHPPEVPVVLEVSRTLTEEKAAVRAVVQEQILASVGMAIGGTLLASLVGVWFVGRPMRKLVEQARRIGEGDFSHRATVLQRDEVGELAREIEAMSGRLSDTQAKLAAENEQRVRVLEQLRHADRLTTVGTLAAGMAHELGTPLNVVLGRAKMIASGTPSTEQAFVDSRIIVAQVDRMVKIIRQLLDFARRGDAIKGRTELRAVAERATVLLDTLARRHGVSIDFRCSEEDTNVLADPAQLEQVITNLIVNGIQAMRTGVLHVDVRRADESPPPDHGGPRGSFLRVEVRDEGTGISADLIPRVFEPFFTTKPVGEGTGLGLSVAYGIVRDHGGWMSVTSRPGAGSAFSVHLPAAETT